MNQTDISGFGSQDPSSVSSTSSTQSSQETSKPSSAQNASTIERSTLEQLIALLAANQPTLQPPTTTATSFRELSSEAGMKIAEMDEQTKHNIINSMWDSFLKGVREMEQRSKKEHREQEIKDEEIQRQIKNADRNGPKSATEYHQFLKSISASERANELGTDSSLVAAFNGAFNTWMIAPLSNTDPAAAHSNGYPSSGFVAGVCAACGSDLLSSIDSGSLSVNPVADALTAVGPNSGLPMDTQAAAAMIAALLNGGAALKTTGETIAQAAAKGQPPLTLDFALNYAQNIKAIATSNLDGDQALNPERQGQNRMVRLMLCVMALNMLYRAAYGGMGAEEFSQIMSQKPKNLPAEIQSQIDSLVGLIEHFLPKGASQRAKILNQINEYIDSKDSVESMLSTTRLFSALLGTDDILGNRLSSSNK